MNDACICLGLAILGLPLVYSQGSSCEAVTPDLDLEDFIPSLQGNLSAVDFTDCALVGSSSGLKGASLGSIIDAHKTVIRVNRLPLAEHHRDLGLKTDIYFSEPGFDSDRPFLKANTSNGGETLLSFFGGQILWCPVLEMPHGTARCPFKAIVYKGADIPEGSKSWRQRFPTDSPGWSPTGKTAFKMAYQSDAVNDLVWGTLRNLGGVQRPTNGLQAFMTFVPICKKLTLYGFDGTGTFDGHQVSQAHHDLNVEHELIDRLMRGYVQLIAPSKSASRTAQSNLSKLVRDLLEKRAKNRCVRHYRAGAHVPGIVV